MATAIKQSKPFQSHQQELYISLIRTASELSLTTERFLRTFGITQIQYNVLRILQGSPSEGLGRKEISERMITPAPDMTRLLDRMEIEGLVLRTRDRKDKRWVATTITPTGRDLLAIVEGPLVRFHAQQLAQMSNSDIRSAIEWLSAVRAGIL